MYIVEHKRIRAIDSVPILAFSGRNQIVFIRQYLSKIKRQSMATSQRENNSRKNRFVRGTEIALGSDGRFSVLDARGIILVDYLLK